MVLRDSTYFNSSPTLGQDGTIDVGTEDQVLLAITPKGNMKWGFVTNGPINSTPALAKNGTVYVGSDDGNFYAVNGDGKPMWRFHTGGMVQSSPAIGLGGAVYFTSGDGNLNPWMPEGESGGLSRLIRFTVNENFNSGEGNHLRAILLSVLTGPSMSHLEVEACSPSEPMAAKVALPD